MEERNGLFNKEMDTLVSKVGEKVKVLYISRGARELEGMKGVLTNVNVYDTISLGSDIFSFVGPLSIILAIADENNNMLYKNNNIPIQDLFINYPDYNREVMKTIQDQQDYLGYSVKAEEMIKGR